MISPLELVRRVDRVAQRWFDRAVHEVMRKTGATKRAMRRHGWGLAILSLAAQDLAMRGTLTLPGGLLMLVYAMFLLGDDACDAQAEQTPGVASNTDRMGMGRKVTGVFGLAMFGLLPGAGLWTAWTGWQLVFYAAWLYQGYLCGTSPTAPKKKPKETAAALQTARAA